LSPHTFADSTDCEGKLLVPSVITRGLSKKELTALDWRPSSDISPEKASHWLTNNGWRTSPDLWSPEFESLMRAALSAHRQGLGPSQNQVGTLFLFQEVAREVQTLASGYKVVPALTVTGALTKQAQELFSEN